jgi:16S rRNA (cytosine1402-N4)-methyltransferase
MLSETLAWLAPRAGGCVVDATVGLGGHGAAILERLGQSGRLIGIDRDPQALALAGERMAELCAARGWAPPWPWSLHRGSFAELPVVLDRLGVSVVDGALFDLGVSSLQLDEGERGFSFRAEGPLDMRMDPEGETTAAELMNSLPEGALADLLWRYGEERLSRRIARRVVERRARAPFRTTRELAELVAGCYPPEARHGRVHPATRSFQALRIAVNDELTALETALNALPQYLATGGRVVVLAYHSLEDRIVKRTFQFLSGRCRCPPELLACACGARPLLKLLTRKPLTPSPEEVASNPRARSARLRAGERMAVPDAA